MYKKKKWNDVLSIISGKSQKDVENPNGSYPIYGSGGIIGYADAFLCDAHTVIIGRKGTINNPIYVEKPFWNIDTAFGLVAGDELLPKYLYYFCKLFNFYSLDKSMGRPSVSKSDLLKIEMPLPTIEEQKYIVEKIEELFSEIDSGEETLLKTKVQLEVYKQAVLKNVFSTFTEKQIIKDMSSIVTSGSRGWAKYYSAAGARFIRITDLTRNRIVLKNDSIQYVDLPTNAEGKRSRLCPNDVLVSITADMGSIALVPEDISEAYINQHISMIRFNNPEQGEFMAWYLKSDYGQKDLLKNKRGGGKLGLGLDDIRSTPVPKVDDATAERIVCEIDARLSVCDNIEKVVDDTLEHAEALRQSILKDAFEGRLLKCLQ